MSHAIRRFHEFLQAAALARGPQLAPGTARRDDAARLAQAWRGRTARVPTRQQMGTP